MRIKSRYLLTLYVVRRGRGRVALRQTDDRKVMDRLLHYYKPPTSMLCNDAELQAFSQLQHWDRGEWHDVGQPERYGVK